MTGIAIALQQDSAGGSVFIISLVVATIVASVVLARRRKAKRKTAPLSKPRSRPPERSPAQRDRTGRVFLCYRRSDSADVAGRIFDRLEATFGRDELFKDVDNIPAGVDYRAHIAEALANCSAVLVVIGQQWLQSTDDHGHRRLDNPADPVRIEIETALRDKPQVVPLLVRNATMPTEADLPSPLQPLAYRNGLPIRPDPDFDRDMERLNQTLAPVLGKAPLAKSHHQAAPSNRDKAAVKFNVDTNAAVTAYINGNKVAKFKSPGSHLHRVTSGHINVQARMGSNLARQKLQFDLEPGETAVVAITLKKRPVRSPLFSVHLEDIQA